MSECNCKVCTDHKRWQAALNPQTNEAKAVFEELLSRLEAAETDGQVDRAVLSGDWPSSVEILEGSLERARDKRKAQEPQPPFLGQP